MKNKLQNQLISVVVPVFNEIKNIEQLIVRLSSSLEKLSMQYEIVFIDDRSTDGTREYLEKYTNSKKVVVYDKQGQPGKAYSLIEGFQKTRGTIIAMIDGDLQYPPEALPVMIKKMETADIVVSNRKNYNDTVLRKILSRTFRHIFGSLLFGLNHDIQSGLKVFTRQVIETVKVNPGSGWAFDLEFLHKASQAGFIIKNFDIDFSGRTNGESKVGIIRTSLELGFTTLLLRFKKIHPQYIPGHINNSSIGAGIGYKKKKYITHTDLSHRHTAMSTFYPFQKVLIFIFIAILGASFVSKPWETAIGFVGVLSFIYFVDVLFNFYLILKSLYVTQEINISNKELEENKDTQLPVYSILCPLYKEAHVVPQFMEAISNLDYPKGKLDVMLLLEEDDKETIRAISSMNLPPYVRMVVVPDSIPKTKPKACNYGLWKAKGDYIVIYDAEDIPDVLQLKKAFIAFQKVPKNVVCLQAKLNYYNPHQNLLTRFFTAEYSLWFDITLSGLQSIRTTIPLGGTSNHFRIDDLKNLQGWDPFNVTEDADLGVRLFKKGYTTAMIDSTTLEEANSNVMNWLRQRSRWLKGYMQTYFVHMRDFFGFAQTHGIHALLFQLVIGLKITFILINPFLWIATISYFALYAIVGPSIEMLYPTVVFYMAVFSLIFGNFLFLYYYMIGCVKRGHFELIKYVFLIPIYWLMISIACSIGFYQLIFKPHYWEKTVHGLHLKKRAQETIPKVVAQVIRDEKVIFPNPFATRLAALIQVKKLYFSSGLLIGASVIGNLLNFLFNAYVGRVVSLETFSVVSVVGGFLYITQIPFSALASSINYRTGFLETRFSKETAHIFWKWVSSKMLVISLYVTAVWLALSPIIASFLKLDSLFPVVAFAPVWLVGFLVAANRGYLSGRLKFASLAVIALIEPVVKLLGAYGLIQANNEYIVYSVIPLSIFLTFIASIVLTIGIKKSKEKPIVFTSFPKRFFAASFLSGLSLIIFLSLDVILAKHYLSSADAGRYALVSLVGKMIFFMGTLSSQFVLPFVSRSEGAKKDSEKVFLRIFFATSGLTFMGVMLFGVFGAFTVPLLFGEKALDIVQYLPLMTTAMMFFAIAKMFVTYYQAKKIYSFSVVTFILALTQLFFLTKFNQDIQSIVSVMGLIGGMNLIAVILLHMNIQHVKTVELNILDLIHLLLDKSSRDSMRGEKMRILIFNWRDTKHIFAGGAELYIHELAKRWVSHGIEVTIFCGNDQHNTRNQKIDGVKIVRRGGSYTVYVWAFLYYVLKFRGKFDAIIDSENGIPFFSPLFSHIPVFLLIHHIHQDVFRKHLSFPLAQIASFLEAKVMPFVYRNNTVITVSESSKQGIIRLGLAKKGNIEIVHPGIEIEMYSKSAKTMNPSFVFVGRLKPYKNVDVAVKAFSQIITSYPKAELSIVGDGDRMDELVRLVRKLKITDKVTFYGKVTDEDKVLILGQSWAVIQPSELEGWGITVIEANACSTPVIASDVHGLRDSVVNGQTGVLVEPKNVDEFAKAMKNIITDQKFRSFLSQSAYLWSHNFSWDISAERFYNVVVSTVRLKYGLKSVGKIALIKQK